LKTIAVKLTPVGTHHSEVIQTLASDPAIGATPNVPSPYPTDGAKVWITGVLARYAAGTEYSFAVVMATGVVGVCSLLGVGGDPRSASLGYWIGRPFWGNGYATEAVSQILRVAFERLDLDRVEASCLALNPASHRVIEKSGFRFSNSENTYDSKRGKHVRYHFTLSESEWRLHIAARAS